MKNNLLSLILGLTVFMSIFASESRADTIESLTFTPPNGWSKQVSSDKTTYQRPSGIGAIIFYASYPANGSPTEEFAKMWRTRLEPILSVKSPQPQIKPDGDFTAAVGMQVVNVQGTTTSAVLTAFMGRGRAICVVSLFAGDDVLREVTAFFDSIKVLPETSATKPNSGSAASGGIEFDYKIPPGLTAKNDGQMILLTPPKLDTNKCAYWISPPRPSKGSLEADARAAALEIPIKGQILNPESYDAMRGTTPDGWKYFLFGTSIQNSAGTSIAYAMALAFPAGAGQVNIVLGLGDGSSNCYQFDTNFIRIFHSLSLRSWTSDGGKTFAKELTGLWRYTAGGAFHNSNNFFLKDYRFMANGRYASGRGSITTTGNLETTRTIASDGSYKLSGNTLTITSDASRDVSKFRVRIYDNHFRGKWSRKMALFNEELKMEKEYEWIEN